MTRSKVLVRPLVAVCFVLTAIAFGGDAGAASPWGIFGEQEARFDAKVVDVLCELTGDCPNNCGDGKRQLGLLQPDDTLILVVKGQDLFAGATVDLLPHCGDTITADGLLIKNEHMTMFALQFLKVSDGKWRKADKFGDDLIEANPEVQRFRWFRYDDRVKAHIEKYGVLGLPGVEPPEQ